MTESGTDPPVACTATDERREAGEERLPVLAGAYAGAAEREDGFTLRFRGTDETLRELAAFVRAEHECCAFATYRLTVEPPYEETRLRLTGPEGTKEVFRDGLIERLAAEA